MNHDFAVPVLLGACAINLIGAVIVTVKHMRHTRTALADVSYIKERLMSSRERRHNRGCRGGMRLPQLASGPGLSSTNLKWFKSSGIDAILRMMRKEENVLLQKDGCAALANSIHKKSELMGGHNALLTPVCTENQVAIARAGGIEVVLSAMEEHAWSVGVQEQGCLALCSLSFNNAENQVAIKGAGGIKAAVLAMKRHAMSVVVQEAGCLALCSLAFNNDNQDAIAGVIEVVLLAMRNHKTSVVLQQQGWAVLRNLALNNVENLNQLAVTIAGAGVRGLEAVLWAMAKHPTSAVMGRVALEGAWIFSSSRPKR